MSKIKRLRVFAGPNGSGKSTLFDSISSKFNAEINKSVYKFIKTFAQLAHLASCCGQRGEREEGRVSRGRKNLTLSGVDF